MIPFKPVAEKIPAGPRALSVNGAMACSIEKPARHNCLMKANLQGHPEAGFRVPPAAHMDFFLNIAIFA